MSQPSPTIRRTGTTPTPKWLLFPVAILLLALFLVGLTFITSRAVHAFRDLTNFIPLALRVLRYTSGVFFAIDHYTRNHDTLNTVMNYQPFALAMTTVRQSLLADSSHEIIPAYWAACPASSPSTRRSSAKPTTTAPCRRR